MWSTLGKRMGLYVLAGWVSLTLNFFLPRLMPGDPAATLFARLQGKLKPERWTPCGRHSALRRVRSWSSTGCI